jgi:hypothetical protein
MGTITVEDIAAPRTQPDPEDALVVMQGHLHAPADWDQTRLERLWNEKHGRSRLGIGLCVANSPRRHFVVSNVPYDVELVRAELESLVAELDAAPVEAGPVEAGPDEAGSDTETVPAQS